MRQPRLVTPARLRFTAFLKNRRHTGRAHLHMVVRRKFLVQEPYGQGDVLLGGALRVGFQTHHGIAADTWRCVVEVGLIDDGVDMFGVVVAPFGSDKISFTHGF